MIFRKAKVEDLDAIEEIIDGAVEFMRRSGLNQWQDGYPNRNVFELDIGEGIAYVLCDGEEIVGVCALTSEPEEAYYGLKGGSWLNDEKYAVIHRSAVSSKVRGKGYGNIFFEEAEKYCKSCGIDNIRIDTHRDNKPMQALLAKRGYVKCGVVEYNTESDPLRDAFQKVL